MRAGTAQTTFRIVVADDHPITLVGVKALLAEQPLRYQLVATAANGEELLAELDARHGIDVVVTDFSMSHDGQDGLRLLKRLRDHHPDVAVVVLTMLNNPALLRRIYSLGIRCIVSKRSLQNDLTHAIECAMKGRPFMSARVRDAVSARGAENAEAQVVRKAWLSPREAETLRLLLTGLGVSEIARILDRSKKTISGQKQSAMAKLGLENDAQLFEYLHNQFER